MCGRYASHFTWKQIHRLLTLTSQPLEFSPRYNVAPTQTAPVVRADPLGTGGPRSVAMLRWGLVPFWAKELKIGASMINARAEGLDAKPAFRTAFRRRRCLVPISGFYEWKKLGAGDSKQPYYIRSSTDDEPLLLAGLWESWSPPDGPPVETYTIITTTPNRFMSALHDRMPVVLGAPDWEAWLDPENQEVATLLPLLKPCADDALVCWPVSTRVNSPRNDDQSCMQPLTQT